MNPIILALIAADFFALSGFGLISPIFAIFIERSVAGGSIAAAGIAQSIYMIVKAVLQVFIGRFNDRDRGYLREFWTALIGYAFIAVVPFLYLTVRTVPQLYAVQVVFGIGAAFAYPGFMTIFTKFADRQREGTEWSMYSTVIFIGMAIAASVGAWAVERVGFAPTFIAVGILGVVGCAVFGSIGTRYAALRRDHHPPRSHPRDVLPVR